MKLCINEMTTMPADLSSELLQYCNAGWHAVELHRGKLQKYLEDHTVSGLRQELKGYDLQLVALIGSAPSDAGLLLARGSGFERYLESLRQQLDLCRAMGIPLLGIGADPARYADRDWAAGAVHNLRVAGDIANDYGVKLAIEFGSLPPPLGPFILDSLASARDIVAVTDHPNVGMTLDCFHFYRSGGEISEIMSIKPGQLIHVHFCDVMDLPREQLDDKHRVLPGEGVVKLDDMATALTSYGFNGFLSLELLNEDLWKLDAGTVARRGLAAMQKYGVA